MVDVALKIARDLTIFGNAVTAVYSSYYSGSTIDIPSDDLPTKLYDDPVPITGVVSAETMMSNDQLRRALTNELAAWLVVSVRDIVKGTELAGKPEYRFLKHVRNGIAHGNKFTFEHEGDVIPRASWNGHQITTELDGHPVISTTDSSGPFVRGARWIEGYVEAGDIKELCSDIMVMAKNLD